MDQKLQEAIYLYTCFPTWPSSTARQLLVHCSSRRQDDKFCESLMLSDGVFLLKCEGLKEVITKININWWWLFVCLLFCSFFVFIFSMEPKNRGERRERKEEGIFRIGKLNLL